MSTGPDDRAVEGERVAVHKRRSVKVLALSQKDSLGAMATLASLALGQDNLEQVFDLAPAECM